MAESSVVVSHVPSGTLSTRRCPRGARPYRRVMAVFRPVSSRNTKRPGSTRRARPRKMARLCRTSGRPCSAARRTFFYRQLQAEQGPGEGAEVDGGGQALVQLRQGRVGLFGDQDDEPVAAVRGHLDGAAGVGLGGE